MQLSMAAGPQPMDIDMNGQPKMSDVIILSLASSLAGFLSRWLPPSLLYLPFLA
jgi:hypothetical protein